MSADTDPLILSLGFDPASFQRLDALRRAHFPPALNKIPAHLTLFHHLPGDQADKVVDVVAEAVRSIPPFTIAVPGLRKLGRGVALSMTSPELDGVRGAIAARFADGLIPQDRQSFRPHVTIQNKVDPKVAATLYDRLTADFTPWSATAEALLLWRYRGGPWEAAGRFDFSRAG